MQSLSVSEKAKFEEEIEQLIAQLDGKVIVISFISLHLHLLTLQDEEISSKAQEIEQMTAERSELQKVRRRREFQI